VGTNRPSYTWNEFTGSGPNAATWYYLWVSNAASTPVLKHWYRATEACPTSSCSVTPAVTLTTGN
jgi:hypothetical protein